MKTLITWVTFAAAVLTCSSSALAQPVQWRIEDGGNDHLYEAIYTPSGIGWTDAQQAATDAGGYLATITSSAENEFVFGLVTDPKFWFVDSVNNTQGPYLGGRQLPTATAVDESWMWDITAEAWTDPKWAFGEPNDGGDYVENHQEDYLQFFFPGPDFGNLASTWNDILNESPVRGYVVEWVPEPSTLYLLALAAAMLCSFRRRKPPTTV